MWQQQDTDTHNVREKTMNTNDMAANVLRTPPALTLAGTVTMRTRCMGDLNIRVTTSDDRLQLRCSWEQNVVLQMNMLMQVQLEFPQSLE
jgi:hypothetical protein